MELMQTALLIPAAGQASRMGKKRNKPYLLLEGKPVLAHTLQAFMGLGLFSPVIVLVAPGEKELLRKWVLGPFFPEKNQIIVVEGGAQRQHSVYNGLTVLQQRHFPGDGFACIHDGARPFITETLIKSVCREALNVGAAVCGIPLKDTIKEINREQHVAVTPPRENYVAVQTPQCFQFSLLWEAHIRARKHHIVCSDDAALVEQLGRPVKVVPGSEDNIKLTTPMDLLLAAVLLKERGLRSNDADIDKEYGSGWGPDCR